MIAEMIDADQEHNIYTLWDQPRLILFVYMHFLMTQSYYTLLFYKQSSKSS